MSAVNVLKAAVIKAPVYTRRGLQGRLFTLAFSGLVYPQIWEDPEVDLAAMGPVAGKRIVSIASGGCNVLAYLTEDPEAVISVRSEEHTSELQSLMRTSYAVFCLKKKNSTTRTNTHHIRILKLEYNT